MNIKRKFFNFLAAVVMILGSTPMTFLSAYADGEPAGDIPKNHKIVTANGDGTYDITIEIEGVSSQKNDATKANVVVVFDTSGSMKENASTYDYVRNNTGRYGLVNGVYMNLYRRDNRRRCVEINNDSTTGTVYSTLAECQKTNPTAYTGARYSRVENSLGTRIQVAKEAVDVLANQLLSQNDSTKPGFEDVVEMAFVDFATNVNAIKNPTTSLDTFIGWVEDAEVQTGNAAGTNWEAALEAARGVSFGEGDTDKTYIIFVSDGNPTFRDSKYDSSATDCFSTHWDWNSWADVCDTDTIWGNGHDDPNSWNLNAAKAKANLITATGSNKELYAVGAFGDATNMQSLGGTYYRADNQDALEEAFADIVDKITMGLSVSDLQITDGITAATSMPVNGTAGAFRYSVPDAWGEPGVGFNKATFENGSVHWNPGHDNTLSNGEKASITFTVWPSQEALDCIAEIKNGETCDKNLETFGLEVKNGNYYLKTNDSASFTYRTATKIEGSDEISYSAPSAPVTIEPERNIPPLPEALLSVTKIWADEMDPKQRDDISKVVLDLYVDDVKVNTYEFTGTKNGKEWINADGTTEGYSYAVAPGVMKKLDETNAELRDLEGVRIVTVGDDEYVVLEEGHDYRFEENTITLADENGTNHYKLTKKLYHPMIVNDGSIHDVVFDGDTATINNNMLSKLSAENTLNGGIKVYKKVINNEVEDTSVDDDYTITVTISEDGGIYRIVHADGTKTDNISFEGHSFTVTIKQSDQILVKDLMDGTTFSVSETLPAGYDSNEITYELIDYNNNGATTTGSKAQVVHGNMSSTATVTNYLTSGDLTITKEVTAKSGNLTQARTKEFNFTVKFYENAGDENPVRTETFTLKHDGTKTFNNIPTGWYYEIVEDAKPGFNNGAATTKTGTIKKGENKVDFKNEYAVSPLSGDDAKITAIKAFVTGYDSFWLNSDNFELQLLGNGEVLDSITVNKLGPTAEFVVDIKAEGTYTYTITEKTKKEDGSSAFRPGVSRLTDDQDIVVTMEVIDNGEGALTVKSKKYSKESRTIFNLYEATSTYGANGELKFNKVLEGRDWEDTDEFTFTIESKDENAPMPKNASLVAKKGKTEIDFGTIEFTEQDAGNTYNYVVKETFDVPSVEPAEAVASGISFTIKVTDNEDGTLNLEVSEHGNTFTNIYKTTSVSASKVWDDDNNRDGLRKNYTNLYVAVKDESGKFVAYETLAAENKDYTFSGLQEKNDEGEVIKYSIVEAKDCQTSNDGTITCTAFTKDDDYTATISGNKITNAHTPAKTSVLIKKTWVGEKTIPDSITVNLTGGGVNQNITITSTDKVEGECTEWCKRIDDLNKFDKGEEIEYTVRETNIFGTSADGFIEYGTDETEDGQKSVNGKWDARSEKNTGDWTITNTWTPATSLYNGSTDFSIKKVDKNGNPLSGVKFTINGEEFTTGEDGKILVEIPVNQLVSSETKNYEIIETVAKDGYDLDGDKANLEVAISSGLVSVNETTLVNTYNKTFTFTASGNKNYVWNKEERMFILENKRSEAKSLTIEKTFSGIDEEVLKGSDLVFTVSGPDDFETKNIPFSDFTISEGKGTYVLKHVPTGDYTVEEKGGEFKDSFTLTTTGDNGATKTLAKGKAVKFTIDNTYAAIADVTYEVAKIWDDDDDRDGLRPTKLSVDLKANGSKVETVELTGDSWSYKWENLPRVNEKNETLTYSVVEKVTSDYEQTKVETEDGKTTFTNKHTPALINEEDDDPENDGKLTVVKTWEDGDDLLGNRPAMITIKLLANGDEIDSVYVMPKSDGTWTYTFTGLYKNADGEEIEYTVEEAEVDGYTAEISGSVSAGFEIVNTSTDPCSFGACGKGEEPDTPNTGRMTSGNAAGAVESSIAGTALGMMALLFLIGLFKRNKKEA